MIDQEDFNSQMLRVMGLELDETGNIRYRQITEQPINTNEKSRSVDYLHSCIVNYGFLAIKPNESSDCFRDYGFPNCKTTRDENMLLSLYSQLVKGLECNLDKLHEACESGKLRDFIQAEFEAKTNSKTAGDQYAWFLKNLDVVNNNNTKHIEICAFCKVRCTQKCSNCRLVSYCSQEHQKKDWKTHKLRCFPVKIMDDIIVKNKSGRVLVATRPIKQGEIVIKEDPLVSGPYLQNQPSPTNKNEFRVCLGCHQVMADGLSSSYACFKCGWPVCSERCELLPNHAHFECKFFQDNPCPPPPLDDFEEDGKIHYLSILLIRCMMLKQSHPDLWSKLRALNSDGLNNKFRSDNAIDLLKRCRYVTADEQVELKKLVNIMDTNRKVAETNAGGNNHRRETHIYELSSYTDHSCIPNAMWVVQKDNKCFVRASIPIAEGEVITTTTSDAADLAPLGTKERREFLQNRNIDCKCKRCSDPTECGTYMSAVKCLSCQSGYLLPEEPLKLPSTTGRICNEAGCQERVDDFAVDNRVQALKEKADEVIRALEAEGQATSPSTLREMEELIKTASLEWVHPNHYLVVLLKRKYGAAVPLLTLTLPHIENHERTLFEEKMVEWTKEYLSLVDIYWPGYSRFRGQILYELQRAMFRLVLTEAEEMMKAGLGGSDQKKDALKTAFEEILTLRKEVTAILSIEPVGSLENDWATEVTRTEGTDFGIVRQVLQYHMK